MPIDSVKPNELEALRRRVADLEAQLADLSRRNEKLDQELRPFQVLADNVSDNIFFKDKDCRFIWANRYMAKIRGLSDPRELIGKTSFDIHPTTERAQQSLDDDQSILRTGKYVINKLETDRYEDGSLMWVMTTKIPMRDPQGNIIGIVGISKDFTKQILAEEVLAREGALRNDLLENLPDAVYFKDRDSRFTWVNKVTVSQLGRQSREDVLGRSDADFFPKSIAEGFRKDEMRIMETGESMINQLVEDTYPDGSPRWVITTKIPLHDREGKVVGTCGITKDFTPVKKAEDALTRENALLNHLLENAPEIVFFKDRDSRFTWVSKAILGLVGARSKSDVIGKTDFDFFSEGHAVEAREDELRIMETGEPILNKLEELTYANGQPRWVYATKMPLYDSNGQIIGTCGLTRDVTALKRAEEALALESNLLRALMQNVPDAIYFKDAQSRFVRVSQNAHLEGLRKPEDAIGKTDFDFFTIDHAEASYRDEQEIIRTGIPIVDKLEKETFNNNRPAAWVSTTKVPIYDKEGKVTGLVGISREVTERVLAEEAIRKAKDELEVRVQERTAALVQEIKEHLRTERALREGERKLQESNLRLESRVNQLHFLNAAAHNLAHFTQRKELLPAVLETFARCFPGVEASLCEMGSHGYHCVAASTGLNDEFLRKDCERALALQGRTHLTTPLFVADRNRDPALEGIEWLGKENLVAYLALPLLVEDKPLAVVQLLAPASFAAWYEMDKMVLATLAAQSAVSLSNANNFQELEKKARLEGELEVAQTIQRRFTPQGKPPIPRVNLKGVYHPAYEVGGDYLDYFQTDSGNWVVVIADVSGKGIPAALVMTMLRSTFRAEARNETSAKRLLCAVNDLMILDLDDKSFVTALCLIIDKDGNRMSYARAGHPPLLLQKGRAEGRGPSDGGQPMSVVSKGMALGMVDGPEFESRLEEVTLELSPGDRFLIFTDGLLEAMDPDRKTYGIKRLLAMLASDRKQEPEKVLKRILDDVRVFTRSEPYHDDLTMLAMEVTG
jgi:PAS domain S-box-containing protein